MDPQIAGQFERRTINFGGGQIISTHAHVGHSLCNPICKKKGVYHSVLSKSDNVFKQMDLWVHISWTNTIRQHHWRVVIYIYGKIQSIFDSHSNDVFWSSPCPHPFRTCILAIEHVSNIPSRSNRSLLKGPTFKNNALFLLARHFHALTEAYCACDCAVL